MNTELRKKEKKMNLKKKNFKVMKNAVFGKTINNLRKLIIIQQIFFRKFTGHRNEMKIYRIINKPVYLGLVTLELGKIVFYEPCYDYVKTTYEEKAKLCYMDIDSFIVCIKTENIYIEISKGVETRFDTLRITQKRK